MGQSKLCDGKCEVSKVNLSKRTDVNRARLGGVVVTGVLISAVAVACSSSHSQPSGQAQENQQQSRDTTAIVTNQPLPGFNYSQLRQNLKEIETAQANGVQTTTFFFNQGVADPIMSCPSVGAPIPSTDQLSNPSQIVHDNYPSGYAALVTEQMDPTGVYTGQSTGTYVMCIGADGKTYANYWEGYVQTVFGNATWDESKHQVSMVGAPSFNFSGIKK